MLYLLVGLAGICGALARYGVGLAVGQFASGPFPLATLLINLAGCFLLGYATHFLFKTKVLHSYAVTALGTGFIGSFTTFSTFSVETVTLMRESRFLLAGLYVALSLFGGLLFSYLGFRIGSRHYDTSKEGAS
ncbi:fluoride efflux transporter CrcB [Exiguobacterium flavidum]|uniref:fluoride efflux transporter CrcB n=1 Tax=Exiguobacterium flavidum TaxID=2184695 RepID=UPI000DF858B5|nr:fluoride efflux transporter CrcB [Exiguobacterium flavidum]